MDVILVIFQLVVVQATELYNILDNSSTWMNAAKSCSLAVPAFVDYDSFTVDIPHGVITENLWVGYYLGSTAFQYIGCMSIGNHNAKVSLGNITPGRCQSVCGRTMYIGISRTSCFCIDKKNINSKTDIRHSYCTDTCKSNIVCGGKGYMSLYKIVKEPENTIFHPGRCLSFENNLGDRHFEWLDCRKSIKTICSFDNGTVSLLNDASRPWNASVQECLRNKGQSTSYTESLTVAEVTGPVWTGIRRGYVIYHKNASTRSNSFSKSTKFGYVTKDSDDRIGLRFGRNEKRLRALCNLDVRNPTTNQGTDRNANIIGVSVGVAVPVALIIVGIVIGFVILKRRRRIPNMCMGNVVDENAGTNVTVSGEVLQHSDVNQTYDHYDVAADQLDHSKENQTNDTDSKHIYCILENRPGDNNAAYTALTDLHRI